MRRRNKQNERTNQRTGWMDGWTDDANYGSIINPKYHWRAPRQKQAGGAPIDSFVGCNALTHSLAQLINYYLRCCQTGWLVGWWVGCLPSIPDVVVSGHPCRHAWRGLSSGVLLADSLQCLHLSPCRTMDDNNTKPNARPRHQNDYWLSPNPSSQPSNNPRNCGCYSPTYGHTYLTFRGPLRNRLRPSIPSRGCRCHCTTPCSTKDSGRLCAP